LSYREENPLCVLELLLVTDWVKIGQIQVSTILVSKPHTELHLSSLLGSKLWHILGLVPSFSEENPLCILELLLVTDWVKIGQKQVSTILVSKPHTQLHLSSLLGSKLWHILGLVPSFSEENPLCILELLLVTDWVKIGQIQVSTILVSKPHTELYLSS
ncbi:hypothetical protein AVEN_90031-1, partial [Araneus ventricosus]